MYYYNNLAITVDYYNIFFNFKFIYLRQKNTIINTVNIK